MALLPGAGKLASSPEATTYSKKKKLKPVQVTSPDGTQAAVVPPPKTSAVPTGSGMQPPINVAPAVADGGTPLPGLPQPTSPAPGTPLPGVPQPVAYAGGSRTFDESGGHVGGFTNWTPAKPTAPAPGIAAPNIQPPAPGQPGPNIITPPADMPANWGGGGAGGGPNIITPPGTDVIQQGGVAINPITGAEIPMRIDPRRSDALQSLLDTAGTSVQDLLANPDVYGGELFNQSVAAGERLLDESFGRRQQQLEADLARRGLDYSSVAAGNLSDLATERARASEDLIRPLLQERALAAGSARNAAISAARGLAGDVAGLEAMERGELRGERTFQEGLRGEARNQAIQELLLQEQLRSGRAGEMQTALAQALASSNPQLAAQLLSGGGNLLTQLAMAQQGGGIGQDIGGLVGLGAGLIF